MGVKVVGIVSCDRCERVQEVEVHGRQSEIYQVISEANREGSCGWETLDSNGRNVQDGRHVLCKSCADAYRDFVRRRDEQEREFFDGK